MKTRKCLGCGEVFDLSHFYSKSSRCKPCHMAKSKEYFKNNPEAKKRANTPEKTRNRRLKQKYNLTSKEWQNMFDSQGGKCACCGIHQSELKRALVVDHCHTTGKVRALLCSHCNSALGYSKESVKVLESLIEYVKEYC